jgi:ATP-dependent DNA helicase RecQ
MKRDQPIEIDRARAKAKAGGRWESLDPVGKGRVQLLPAGRDRMTQAVAVMTELRRLAALDPQWAWTRAAVIAREWRFLEPVRSYCELNGIPVQMADEAPPHFWRLRETQQLLDWLRAGQSRLVSAPGLTAWLGEDRAGPWWDLLREAAAEYALETGGAELPTDHFVEWLAEWGREVRRRQSGLLLLTAHRAKGLEFDHVAVIDGGWDRVGRNEDPDAPRRLYYVAMTRARQTLTLARFDGPNPLLSALAGHTAALARAPIQLPPPGRELARSYVRATLGDVDLGFAGRFVPGHAVHGAIASLSAGDELSLDASGTRLELLDRKGGRVGRLARAFVPPKGAVCVQARVAAVVARLREDSDPDYQDSLRCDRWEVVVPELVFEPTTPELAAAAR